MADGGSRKLLDDNGRLLGLVNVVDVLVVLVVLAIVVAGAAFVLAADEDDPEVHEDTRYVTIDLGEEPPYVVSQLSPGDEWKPGGTADSLTITDVARYSTWNQTGTPTEGVVIRAAVTATSVGENAVFEFDDKPLRVGQTLHIETAATEVSGTVAAVEESGDELATSQTPFVLRATLSPSLTADLQAGDDLRVGGIDATVEDVTVYATGAASERTVVLGLTGTTYDDILADQPPIRAGVTVPVELEASTFTGDVVRRGTLEQPGSPQTHTATLELENVKPRVADGLAAGQTEATRGTTTAEIQSVSTEPATVYVETADGDLVSAEHPTNQDVELAVELSVRVLDDGTIYFRGEPLRNGDTITLELDRLTITGEVGDLDS